MSQKAHGKHQVTLETCGDCLAKSLCQSILNIAKNQGKEFHCPMAGV